MKKTIKRRKTMHENGQLGKNTPSSVLCKMPEAMLAWMRKNYKKIDPQHMTDEQKTLNWETACSESSNWKYGRFKICRNEQLYRDLTMEEFYGNSIVD